MLLVSIIILSIGISLAGGAIVIFYQRQRIISAAEGEASALFAATQQRIAHLIGGAEKDAAFTIKVAQEKADQLKIEAKHNLRDMESKLSDLTRAEQEIIARLKESTKALMRQSDLCNSKASILEYIGDDELLDSESFQEERNEIRAAMKKQASDAIYLPSRVAVNADIARFASITAKADIVGALLVTTAEMLADRVTPGNGKATMDKLDDTLACSEALLKLTDSGATIRREFADVLRRRITSQWQYRRAQEAQREAQREAREQEREERRARQEAEKAQAEAEHDEAIAERAIAQAEARLRQASDAERSAFEAKLHELRAELAEAHRKAERAKSRAQETRQGHVYIVSNIGSFGDGVFKIGMTRRIDPMDRIWELSDASVPFDFDVHAMIECDDAPSLESSLHRHFGDRRINKVNFRKEFFRVSLDEIRGHLFSEGRSPTIRLIPSADEYYASMRLCETIDGADVSKPGEA